LAPEMRQRLKEDHIEISSDLEKLLERVCPIGFSSLPLGLVITLISFYILFSCELGLSSLL